MLALGGVALMVAIGCAGDVVLRSEDPDCRNALRIDYEGEVWVPENAILIPSAWRDFEERELSVTRDRGRIEATDGEGAVVMFVQRADTTLQCVNW